MKRNNRLMIILLALTPVSSFAFFCPTNFSQIEMGMSIDQVTQICGKPATQKESLKPNENIPQEWTYFVPQTVVMNNHQTSNGTLKTSMAFDSSGRAINISVNGVGVGATTICGSTISLGDTRDTVKGACGEPAFNNKQGGGLDSVEGGGPPPTKIVEFTYTSNPPATLVFENGVLKERR